MVYIDIGEGITIEGGITIGDVPLSGTQFITEDAANYLVSEIDQNFIEE